MKVKQDTKDYDKKLYRQSVRGNVKGLQVEMGMYLNCFSRVQSWSDFSSMTSYCGLLERSVYQ